MSETPAHPALEVRALTVAYDETPALSGIDLSVAPGEMLAVLGPSGCGKSTLLHTVAGFLAPCGGEIWLNGSRVADQASALAPEHRDVAMVFQSYALWPHLTALDTVAYPLRRRGLARASARREAARILDLLQVGHLAGRRPSELSGGEQQRVGLGRALARNASVYLFDEPTAHLDTHVRGRFVEEVLLRRRESGAAAVYATHDAGEALGIADRVALVSAGRVVQIGIPQEVYERPLDLWAARLTGPASVLATPRGTELVRPGWAGLGGERSARVEQVWFRGPHTDYNLATEHGRLLVRHPGPPEHASGDRVAWHLDRSWPLEDGTAAVQASSSVAGPE